MTTMATYISRARKILAQYKSPAKAEVCIIYEGEPVPQSTNKCRLIITLAKKCDDPDK